MRKNAWVLENKGMIKLVAYFQVQHVCWIFLYHCLPLCGWIFTEGEGPLEVSICLSVEKSEHSLPSC